MTRADFPAFASHLVLLLPLAAGCASPGPVESGPSGNGLGGGAGSSADSDPTYPQACQRSCSSGEACCDGACVDIESDAENCGACGAACSSEGGTSQCMAGVCTITCDAGFVDCDSRVENGCEALDPGAPEEVVLLRPTLGAFTGSAVASDLTGSLRPTFSWRSQEGACADVTYELQLDDSCPLEGFAACAFESPEVDEFVLGDHWSLEEGLPVRIETPVGTRYFWRVRACDVLERCSGWSDVRYLDVGRDRQDVTGDGYPDVVVQDEAVTGNYMLYTGGPQFGLGPTGGPTSIVPTRVLAEIGSSREFQEDNPPVVRFVGDVNGDGFQDFVADGPEVDALSPPGDSTQNVHCLTRLLYLGAASAEGILPVLFDSGSWAPGGLAHNFAAGDVDADGYADVWGAQSIEAVVAMGGVPATTPAVFLFRGHGAVAADVTGAGAAGTVVGASASFRPALSIHARPDDDGDFLGVSVEPGDFNGDGRIDVAIVAPRAHVVYVALGGALDTVVDRAISYGGLGAAETDCRDARLSVADFDADGFDDFSVNCAQQRIVEVYFGSDPLGEEMTFEKLVNPSAADSALDTLAVDFDGDGAFELLTGGGQNYAETLPSVWLFSGLSGRGSEIEARALPLMGAAGYFGAADHNGDGHVDLVIGGVMPAWMPGQGSLDPPEASDDPNGLTSPRYLSGNNTPLVTRVVGR